MPCRCTIETEQPLILRRHPAHPAQSYEQTEDRKRRQGNTSPVVAAVTCGGVFFTVLLLSRLMSAIAGNSRGAQAFAMSLGAGMATGIGACFVLCTTSLNRSLLAMTMSFSAGVMVYVSLVEVVAVSDEYFRKGQPASVAYACATASFFGGVLVMAFVDAIVHRMFDAVSGATHSHDHRHQHSLGSNSECGDSESPPLCGGAAPEDGEAWDDEGGASIRALAHVKERKRLLMMSTVISTAIVLRTRTLPPDRTDPR